MKKATQQKNAAEHWANDRVIEKNFGLGKIIPEKAFVRKAALQSNLDRSF